MGRVLRGPEVWRGQYTVRPCLTAIRENRNIWTAHYFIANAALNDYDVVIDFRAPKEPVYYDNTAAVCAACGLLELSEHVSEYEKDLYVTSALRMLHKITNRFCNWNVEEDGITMAGSACYHREDDREVPIIYGDYFLVEAVLRILDRDFLIW